MMTKQTGSGVWGQKKVRAGLLLLGTQLLFLFLLYFCWLISLVYFRCVVVFQSGEHRRLAIVEGNAVHRCSIIARHTNAKEI